MIPRRDYTSVAAKKYCTTLCLPRQGWVGAMIYPAIKTRFMEMKIQFSHIAFLKEASTLSPLKWIFGSDQSDLEYNLWEMARLAIKRPMNLH